MNKNELLAKVAQKTNLSKAQSGRVLDAILGVIGDELKMGGDVSLPDFGKFSTYVAKAHKAHIPITGRVLDIPAKTRFKFKAFQNIDIYSAKY